MTLPNIILTGFMGTGKSSVGRLLAEMTDRPFYDTDELIIERAGLSISEIFTLHGEEHFRELESELTKELSAKNNSVVATGGRLLLDPLNALLLSENGLIFCLNATVGEIVNRVGSQGGRPLIDGPDPEGQISQLLASREDGYKQFYQVKTSGETPDQVASEIMETSKKMVIDGLWPQKLTSKLAVHHPAGKYPIFVGEDLLSNVDQQFSIDKQAVIITDENVGPLYSHLIGPESRLPAITLPSGEEYKRLETVIPVYKQLLELGLDRSGTIIALGGGVVGDMAGFIAATYMRGVGLIHCPTTLLAMVDASIGGKSGVDLEQGKNLVGAFKQPRAVVVDLATLGTLPAEEYLSGMAEVIKHGVINSPDLLMRIGSGLWKYKESARDNQLQTMVVEAILIKKEIVEKDPFERGIRAHLNLGHTFAHAIETLSSYQIKHGYAVSMGITAAAYLSHALGHCALEPVLEIEDLLNSAGLPSRIPSDFNSRDLVRLMMLDKKRSAGDLRFVLIRSIGDVFVKGDVPTQTVIETITRLQEPN